jgi:hypothetical protein
MDLTIRVVSQHNPADELRLLGRALRDSAAVTGELTLTRERPVAQDRLGSWVDAVSVAVGTGGAATVFIRELARYLLRRSTDLDIEISRGPDGTRIKLSAKGLRAMSASQLEQTVRQIGSSLDSDDLRRERQERQEEHD